MKKPWVAVLTLLAVFGIIAAGMVWWQNHQVAKPRVPISQTNKASGEIPKLQTQEVVVGLDHPWDVAVLPDKAIIYTERAGGISVFTANQKRLILKPNDLYARGEGGMMGLAVDPDFSINRYIYTCFSTTRDDVRLVRWKLTPDNMALLERKDIITGMPLNPSGRHSGCRPRFSPDGVLWVGTGDVAIGTNPQDPKSLGGKVLRVDRDGNPVPGNLGGNYDPRIHSYGHRNVQGIAFRTFNGRVLAFSVEHGPGRDDEVNVMRPGNYGWNPTPGYNEAVPMTDTIKYPEAIKAVWSSGNPSIAPSGGTFLIGKQWKIWEGALAIAVLKDRHLRILHFDANTNLTSETKAFNTFGRLRIAVQALDGSLYITTDNGGGRDVILQIQPQ